MISVVVGSSPIVHPISFFGSWLARLAALACALLVLSACSASQPSPFTLRKNPPRLFIAGDSTAATYVATDKPQQGWGAELQTFFDPSKLEVVNAARGGRSSRTFITEGHWDEMLAEVRAGDFVIIQFGHNDAGALNEEPPGSTRPLRARGTIPGIGSESEEIDNVITGRHETVYTFGHYLRRMIADTRSKGATPILVTLTRTNTWENERITCRSDTYRLWNLQVSRMENVAFVDLSRIIADRYQYDGPDITAGQFAGDHVHTNVEGARRNAADVVAGLKALRGMPFLRMLSAAGRAVPPDHGPSIDSPCPPSPARG